MVKHAADANPAPRIGVIGGGFMGRVHSRAARAAGAVLDTVATSGPAGSARAAAELGFANSASVDELIDRSHDVVHVCTPNDVHAEQCLRALDAGSAVICEKPLATDSQSARAVLAHAEEKGLKGTIPFVYRFHPDGPRGPSPLPRRRSRPTAHRRCRLSAGLAA